MSEVYKISKALEDLRNYYGLKEIKNVTLNMEGDDPEISFISNKPKMFDDEQMPDKVVYILKLAIRVDSLVKKDKNEENS